MIIKQSYKINKKALTYYMAALLGFFLIINYIVINQQRALLDSENRKFVTEEIKFFSKLTNTYLITRDYANIESTITEWGKDSSNIVSIKLTAKNGFVIANFTRDMKATFTSTFNHQLRYGSDSFANLEVVTSADELHREMLEITGKLIAGSIILVIIFGVILWKLLLRTAINPLQDEILQHQITSEKLREAKRQAEHANRSKSEFLANMSHEIRTPMNGVLGMLNLLLDTPLNDKQYDFARTAYNSGETLLAILNDILDFSKIEAGKLKVENLPFNPFDLIEETVTLMANSARDKHLELIFHIDPQLPTSLMGDGSRLRQILTNLVSNALKFTEHGEILVSGHLEERNNQPFFVIRVKDTGIGIKPEKQDKIFSAFEQADSSTTRVYGGTGLGLSISKRLAKLMNGDLKLEDSSPAGSTFCLCVPAVIDKNEAAQPLAAYNSHEQLKDKTTLLVDDNATNLKILENYCEQWQLNFMSADSAQAALALLAKAHQQKKQVDIIITDMMMPGMDGNQFSELVKDDPRNAGIPIILLTSLAPESEAGQHSISKSLFNNVLMKPVRQSTLFDALVSLSRPHKQSIAKEYSQQPFSGHSAILAEDNITNQRVAEGMLKKLGFEVRIAANGQEAIELLKQKQPDIIFMDCQMPELDGYEATHQIRNLQGPESKTTIIAMTANAMQEDRDKCLQAGMDDYIAKPLRFQYIEKITARWLHTEPVRLSTPDSAESTSLLDDKTIESLKSVVGDNYTTILEEFRTHTLACLDEIQQKLDTLTAEDIIKKLHTLKGSSSNVGAARLAAFFKQLEDTINQNQSTDEIGPQLDTSRSLLNETISALKEVL